LPHTRALHDRLGARPTNTLFLDLLSLIEDRSPAEQYTWLYLVVDHAKIHQAKAVDPWVDAYPRMTLLLLSTYCPRANPIECVCGALQNCCPRNHPRQRFPDLVAGVADHLDLNGPWAYTLSVLQYEPAVTTAMENITGEALANIAA
jgi:hypothetical protein